MDTTEAWIQISQERQNLHTYLLSLPEGKWQSSSTRTGWNIRQLAAHIILESNYTWLLIGRYIIQSRFDTNRFMDVAARNFAASHSPEEILAVLKANITNHRLPPGGITPQEALIDLWIHTQDIKQAAGETGDLSEARMEFILDFVHSHPESRGLKVMGIHQKLKN